MILSSTTAAAITSSSASSSSSSNVFRKAITKRVILHWFRHGDLRLHDNQALTHSSLLSKDADLMSNIVYPVIPIFVFDEKIFGTENRTPAGSLKCGVRRAQFIIESIQNLRSNLQTLVGSQLLVAYGDPYDVVDTVLSRLKKYYIQKELVYHHPIVTDEENMSHDTDTTGSLSTRNSNSIIKNKVKLDLEIVCQREYSTEEREAVIDMTHLLHKYTKHIVAYPASTRAYQKHQELQPVKRQIHEIWGSTLYLHNRSPFDRICKMMPNDFRDVSVRLTKRGKMDLDHILPIPEHLPFPHKFDCSNMASYIPTLSELGYTTEEIEEGLHVDPRNTNIFVGGETEAGRRCHEYIFSKDLLRDYKHRRTKATIMEYQSSKLSPYLAHGCISPRLIAAEAKRACINKAEYHLYLAMINWELIQRDYCRYYTVKHGKYIFLREGPVRPKRLDTRRLKNLRTPSDFTAWTTGQTGYPLVDAAMRELKCTGWINNRCRMYVASFLFSDLDHDWTRGADYFESTFIDYNVYCNWVNWCVSTGLNDGKQYMRYIIQIVGRKYDPEGEYVKKWVPELKDVPPQYIHKPWKMSEEQQVEYNSRLGIDYPHPIRDPNVGDERRKYRYLRRRGMDIPSELEENVKTRIRKDLNRDHANSDGEKDEQHFDDEEDSDDGEDFDDEDDYKAGDKKAGNAIDNEILRKMNTSKKELQGKNTGKDWFRGSKDSKSKQEATSDNNSEIATTSESTTATTTKPSSPTKNKWRINL